MPTGIYDHSNNKNGFQIGNSLGKKGKGIKKNFSKYYTKILQDRAKEQGLKNKGSNNGRWKGGKFKDKYGYVWIYCPEHPFATDVYVKEHRLVMEKFLKRYLNKEEKIHHINGIKDDNRLENLRVMTNTEHSRLHMKEKLALGII